MMIEIRQTEIYARWFRRLRDRQARVRVDNRIRRLSLGNPGDVRPIGEGCLRSGSTMDQATECISSDEERN